MDPIIEKDYILKERASSKWFSCMSTLCVCMRVCKPILRMVEINCKIKRCFIFYHEAFSHIHVTVTDGYYRSVDNHEPITPESSLCLV
jgi:hypothetical protein